MATPENAAVTKILKLQVDAQEHVLSFARSLLAKNQEFQDFRNKMNAIDIAYARYQSKKAQQDTGDGVDPIPEGGVCCDVFDVDNIVPPIVVSQVDSFVAYLAEVFLSGSPMFPVVSNPTNRKYAEQLETLLDDHAQLGGYARQLLMFIRDAVKYNFSALEVEWDSISQFTVLSDYLSGTGQTLEKGEKKFNKVKRLNPRNVIWDWSIPPGDVAEHGDYAGYVERMSRTKLKRLLNKWTKEGRVYNVDKAMESSGTTTVAHTPNYTEDPQISNYIPNANANRTGINWDAWFEHGKKGNRRPPYTGAMYEVFYLYARIMPSDFGITAPQKNTPQIWKFVIVNNQFMVYAERVISAYDLLPVLFGQPLEDGLGYQTQSVAEGAIPFQEATTTLYNIRFAASRRAVSDRALYIADMIKPTDINNPTAAPKIPVHISALSNKGISDSYMSIPFDMRGTETTIQDATIMSSFVDKLYGINSPRQGQFQKGNKSVREWDDTMGSSDGRMRLPALTLEHQVFSPLKSIMALNIFQHGEDTIVVSQVSGNEVKINIPELRKQVLSFKIADGYTPKSKLANTEVLLAGMNMVSQSPVLQQAYGAFLPGMFGHFMSLSGLKGFEEYDPRLQTAVMQPPAGLAANTLQPAAAATQEPIPPNAQPVV